MHTKTDRFGLSTGIYPTKGFLSTPNPGLAMDACRDGLRLRAREFNADIVVVGCRFQVNFGSSTANVTDFGTAIRTG